MALHSWVSMKRVSIWTPAYPILSAAAKSSGVPTPPAHTTGSPRSWTSSSTSSTPRGPAWPPARRFTAMSPWTPASTAFWAHFRSVTSWYTTPPTCATASTTHRGLPREVTKKRTPSSRARSTQRTIRWWYAWDEDSMRAFIPTGREVRERIFRSPSRKSYPWT